MRSLALSVFFLIGCGGTTGSALVTFAATASGPADATGGPLSFTSGSGAQVTLTSATLHIDAVYLNQAVPVSGAAEQPCILPGIYVAQVFGPLDVDLLSPSSQAFPTQGEGTQTPAKTAEVWLTGGDINAAADPTVIFSVAGTAVQNSQTFPFTAKITIGANRQPAVTNPAMPGANPICHERIVTKILVNVTPTNLGTLVLTVDPRPMFNSVDFTTLTQVSTTPLLYQIPDTSAGPGGALFDGLKANYGVYAFAWEAGL